MARRGRFPARPGLLSVYEAVFTLVFILATPFWIYRRWHFPQEMRERFGIVPDRSATPSLRSKPHPEPLPLSESGRSAGPLWFHAASLGELEAALALIESGLVPDGHPLYLTVTSTSARVQAQERLRGRAEVSFAPLDLPWLVERFLSSVTPSALIILETELWPRMIWGCQERGIPVFVASGRLSDRKWRRSRALRWFRSLWKELDGVAVQTARDGARFSHLGVEKLEVCGNVKYRESRVPAAGRQREADPGRPLLWVIGSLRRGEEAVLEVARECVGERAQVVFAPRHLREMDHWCRVLAQQDWSVHLRSEWPSPDTDVDRMRDWMASLRRGSSAQTGSAAPSTATAAPSAKPGIVLLDLHGELQQWYEIADLASVGGSWVRLGGHNLFEAVRAGCSVSFGAHIQSVADVAEVLVEEEIGFQIPSPTGLREWLKMEQGRGQEERERAAQRATRRLAGAVERTRHYFEDLRPDLFGGRPEV